MYKMQYFSSDELKSSFLIYMSKVSIIYSSKIDGKKVDKKM